MIILPWTYATVPKNATTEDNAFLQLSFQLIHIRTIIANHFYCFHKYK